MYIKPCSIEIMSHLLSQRDLILNYGRGVLRGFGMDKDVIEEFEEWLKHRVTIEHFAHRMDKKNICQGRIAKSVQHARAGGWNQMMARLFGLFPSCGLD